jgi:hypothetical protein
VKRVLERAEEIEPGGKTAGFLLVAEPAAPPEE